MAEDKMDDQQKNMDIAAMEFIQRHCNGSSVLMVRTASDFATAQLAPYRKALKELVETMDAVDPDYPKDLDAAYQSAKELLATEKTDRASL